MSANWFSQLTGGSNTWAPGQDSGLFLNIDTAGALALAGQTITPALTEDLVASVDSGAVSVSGQTIGLSWTTPWDEGTVSITGQTIVLTLAQDIAVPVTAGTLTLQGQTITPSITGHYLDINLDAAAVTLAGQDVWVAFYVPGVAAERTRNRAITLSRRRYSRG